MSVTFRVLSGASAEDVADAVRLAILRNNTCYIRNDCLMSGVVNSAVDITLTCDGEGACGHSNTERVEKASHEYRVA